MVVQRKNGYQKTRVDRSGLGRAIVNRRAKQAKIAADPTLHTSEIASGLSSVTQENDLDEFLSTAQLAETDFSAEKQNIKVVADPSLGAASHNPYLLTPQQERDMRQKHRDHASRLQVPRRPSWNRTMTVVDLERRERDSFLEWRRGLADLQDNQALLLTPFERNLEVWRQLWRTCERSDLVVQIVDARNPLSSRSEDLEKYVLELNHNEQMESTSTAVEDGNGEGPSTSRPKKKKNLLLINKSDMLTRKQREGWADYFEENDIQYAFFSAANGIALQEERARLAALSLDSDQEHSESLEETESEEEPEELGGMKIPKSGNKLDKPSRLALTHSEEESDAEDTDDELAHKMERGAGISTPGDDEPARTRILSVLELEELFLKHAPQVTDPKGERKEKKTVVGLVGYPNVGKSSTINALLGEKKVSVSSTPGKTKHFQTIKLSEEVLLCDCPGLVFPQFAATKADLVCDGVLPIDQMREHTGPVALVTQRIPQAVLEGIYGVRIVTLPVSEGGTGVPTAVEFLTTYSIARGFFTGGMGNADTSRASRFVMKDYVNGKLLYCFPPPHLASDAFNEENRDIDRLRSQGKIREKRAPTTRVPFKADTYVPQVGEQGAATALSKTRQSSRAKALDNNFFSGSFLVKPTVRGVAAEKNGGDFSRVRMFPHQGKISDAGIVAGGKASRRKVDAASKEADADDKKHFKPRRQKKRSGRGYDD